MKNPTFSFSFLFSFYFLVLVLVLVFLALLKFNSSQKHAFQIAHFGHNVQTWKDAVV